MDKTLGSSYITTLKAIYISNIRPKRLAAFFDRQLTPACVRTSRLETITVFMMVHILNSSEHEILKTEQDINTFTEDIPYVTFHSIVVNLVVLL